MTKRDILTEMLVEIGVLDPGDTMSDRQQVTAENAFDRLLDDWNADRQAVYAMQRQTFTLTPSLSPHTIGPSGATWTSTQRPVSIEEANLVLTGGIRRPITIRDQQWYADQRVPALESSIPLDLYYQPDWPLGKLYFFPVPSTAYTVDLWSRMVLSALTIDASFDLPPGYRNAVMLTCAEYAAGPFAAEISGLTVENAAKARRRIFSNNQITPRLTTRDGGMTQRRHGRFRSYEARLP